MNWKYTDNTREIVSRVLSDGSLEYSCIAAQHVQEWLAEGNTPLPVDPPTPEQDAILERRWRDSELAVVDIEVNKSMDTSSPNEVLWRQYREALRHWPQTVGFPDPSFRPIPPEV